MDQRYGPAAQFLHWVIALMVIIIVPLGLIVHFDWVAKLTERPLIMIHIGLGLIILALMVVRLLRRLTQKPPLLPESISRGERIASKIGHYLFYALLFAMPVFGILFMEAHGHRVSWFGLFTLPMIVGKSATIHHLFAFLHFWGGIAVILVFVAHISGVLRHDVIRRDGILRRMLPMRN